MRRAMQVAPPQPSPLSSASQLPEFSLLSLGDGQSHFAAPAANASVHCVSSSSEGRKGEPEERRSRLQPHPLQPPTSGGASAGVLASMCAVAAPASASSAGKQQHSAPSSAAPSYPTPHDDELEEDTFGTRIPLASLCSLALDSPPHVLLDRAQNEMELLAQMACAPAARAELFTEAMTHPDLQVKNRYSNIIPSRGARIVLPADPDSGSSASSDQLVDGYINACLLAAPLLPGASAAGGNETGCAQSYIACQAPLPSTCGDFWRMVWAQGTNLVVMLTREKERDARGNVTHKAHAYWPEATPAAAGTKGAASTPHDSADPDELPSARFGAFTVTLLSTRTEPDLIVRELLLSRSSPSSASSAASADSSSSSPPPRVVHHLQYTGWPDFGVPDDGDVDSHGNGGGMMHVFSRYRELRSLLGRQKVEDEQQNGAAAASASVSSVAAASATASVVPAAVSAAAPLPPIIVHCSAGVGRSGVLIAIDAMLDSLAARTSSPEPPANPLSVDLFRLTLRMRRARQGMLQTPEQYALVLHFVARAVRKGLFGVRAEAALEQARTKA